MAEYPGAVRAAVSPNRSTRQGKVKLFIVHHYAGTQDPEGAWRRFNAPNDRSVSPNYQVNADGSVFEVVPPDNFRAWTTGAIDHQAVTCETQNTSGEPNWGISRESHEAIAHLIAWAAKRYGFPIQRGAVADGNVVTKPGVVGHRETPAGRQTSTSCPGPSMDLDYLVARAIEIANGIPLEPKEEDRTMEAYAAAPNGTVLHFTPGAMSSFESQQEYETWRAEVIFIRQRSGTDLMVPPVLSDVVGISWATYGRLVEQFGIRDAAEVPGGGAPVDVEKLAADLATRLDFDPDAVRAAVRAELSTLTLRAE